MLGVADRDPGLYETWVDELAERATRERRAANEAAEINLATAQILSLFRNEFLLSKGVNTPPPAWVPSWLREKPAKFSPRAFALAHYRGGD